MKRPETLNITPIEYGALIAVREMLKSGVIKHNPRPTRNKELLGYAVMLHPVERGHEPIKGLCRFNMQFTGEHADCGTVGCIGGWMAMIMGEKPDIYVARQDDIKGLGSLFYPRELHNNWRKITSKQAIQAIDNFLKTGDPKWKKVAPKLIAKSKRGD